MLKDTLTADLKDAMREKDKVRLSAIRMIRTAITEKEKAGTGVATEDDVLAIIAKQAKQRRDSIAQFEVAGRDDLAAHEAAELAVIEAYLPAQATDEEIRAVVDAVVARTGATSMKDMGKVMGPAMGQLKGVAEGGRVQAAVKAALGAG
ncbi:glutamyl-tRNA amidotransferase [Rubrivirga sp. SAORIC476]|uniref:GatB/YqeY domain-containing protein n=1 Tax=Rubrivirga sp. SAORIC476 TaxID=1961794 RepID=UPI000BA98F1C|nr:GatB/YqeY domain-containing protein [Rubrivirga sp. SAORIC476]PAP74845.1 glutamyl-tRNA amidotransferase [Rubrivirga sp. SAORIC476]